MTRPTRRPDSSHLQFRKRVPADIQKAAYGRCASVRFPSERPGDPPIVVQAKLQREVKFSLQTRDPAIAKEPAPRATGPCSTGALARAGVLDSVADAIQGHIGSRGEADGYRHSSVQVMNKAIKLG